MEAAENLSDIEKFEADSFYKVLYALAHQDDLGLSESTRTAAKLLLSLLAEEF